MDISVRVWDGPEPGARRHFCPIRGRELCIEIDGASRDIELFCPLCGAPVVEQVWDVRQGDIDRCPAYRGPRCEHGHPDTTCSELAALDPGYGYMYWRAIPEFELVELAEDFGEAGLIAEWARPCAICRAEFARARYGVLIHDLRRLCECMSRAGIAGQRRADSIRRGMALAHGLLADLDQCKDVIRAERSGENLGYVYAITDGAAIKIGWSGTHPSARMAQLQTASPNELQLIWAVLAASHEEHSLHRRFAEHRIRGEWFRHVPEIVEYFVSGS